MPEAPAVWCLPNGDLWCAVRGGQKPNQFVLVHNTSCGQSVAVAGGHRERRVPSCPSCSVVVSKRKTRRRP